MKSLTTTQEVTCTIKGFGFVRVTSAALDAAMSKYLPASPAQLRELVEHRCEPVTFKQVSDVSAFLIILADIDYNTDEYAGTDLCIY